MSMKNRQPGMLAPFKFKWLRKEWKQLKDGQFRLLDVGAGEDAATLAKRWFPNCAYFGVDLREPEDSRLADAYYNIDLTTLDFDCIGNDTIDVIMMSHVVEHLYNGDNVLAGLLPKLKSGGFVYVEFPGIRSTRLPHMRGTLNFFDDGTHCRLYSLLELCNLLMRNNCTIIKAGTRRDIVRIILMPALIPYYKAKYGYVPGRAFWDLLGFAEFVFAQKRR